MPEPNPNEGEKLDSKAFSRDQSSRPDPLARPTVAFTHALASQLASLDEASLHEQTDFEFAEPIIELSQEAAEQNADVILGEYSIEALIGRGGMGNVFRARHRMMDRLVAVKVLPANFADNEELVARFFLEVKAIAKLLHPNIVTAFDAGRSDSMYYLVMELIQGSSLTNLIHTQGPTSIEEAVDIVAQAASALQYAHQQGIIHLDVKPSNIMLTTAGQLKILDFGLVRIAGEQAEAIADQRRRLMGTIEYMSPEQIRQSSNVDLRADLYALGATLYFILTGQTMFTGEPMQIAMAHLHETPPVLYEVRGDVDLRLDALFQKLVAKSPSDRFNSASEVLQYLEVSNLRAGGTKRLPTKSTIARDIQNALHDSPTRGFSKQPTKQRVFANIGIDFGLSQTIAYCNGKNDPFETISLEKNQTTLDNSLWSDDQQLLIGTPARDARKRSPEGCFHSLHRWLGFARVERDFCGRQVPPEVLIAALLHHTGLHAQTQMNATAQAVLTIPASYDQRRRIAIANACKIGGLDLLQLLDRPLAASIAYASGISEEEHPAVSSANSSETSAMKLSESDAPIEHHLIISLTGNIAEASVVRRDGMLLQLLSNVGDWQMSKLRWQARLAEKFTHDIEAKCKLVVREDIQLAGRLQRLVEQVCDVIFEQDKSIAQITVNKTRFQWQINLQELLDLCSTELIALDIFIQRAIELSKLRYDDIDQILLIGDWLTSKAFVSRRQAILNRVVPEAKVASKALAKAAVLQGNFLIQNDQRTLVHGKGIVPYDIAVGLSNPNEPTAEPKILLSAGMPTPSSYSRTLRLGKNFSRFEDLQFFERSRPRTGRNWSRFSQQSISNTFPKLTENDPLQLTTKINASGIWSATVHDLQHNEQTVVPPLGEHHLTEESIAQWRRWLETAMLCAR